jgi:hypothetical protein
MADLLQSYTDIVKQNKAKPMTRKSRKWFMDLLMSGALNSEWSDLRKDKSVRVRNVPMLGKMYTFSYIPKHKKTLPYYDRYPLILLADFPQTGDGFYGLNLHYLHPKTRAVLLSRLVKKYGGGANNLDDNTRIKMTYPLLKSASRLKYFKPTFKRYLPDKIRSSIVEIPPEYWETAIWLPTQKFIGSNTPAVWAESKRAYR